MAWIILKLQGYVLNGKFVIQALFEFVANMINLAYIQIIVKDNVGFQVNLLIVEHPGVDVVHVADFRVGFHPPSDFLDIKVIGG